MAPSQPAQRPATRRRPARNLRWLLVEIDLWTVLKLSVLFYLCLVVIGLVCGAILWVATAPFHVIPHIEKTIRSAFAVKHVRIRATTVLPIAAGIGVGLAILASLLNVLLAFAYNLISDLVGGTQAVLTSEEPAPAPGRLPPAPNGAAQAG